MFVVRAQGTRRKSLLTCKGVGGGQPSGPGFSSLKYLAQVRPHSSLACWSGQNSGLWQMHQCGSWGIGGA